MAGLHAEWRAQKRAEKTVPGQTTDRNQALEMMKRASREVYEWEKRSA